jgi:hypothetical protein
MLLARIGLKEWKLRRGVFVELAKENRSDPGAPGAPEKYSAGSYSLIRSIWSGVGPITQILDGCPFAYGCMPAPIIALIKAWASGSQLRSPAAAVNFAMQGF